MPRLFMHVGGKARRTAQNQTCLILFLFSKPFCIFANYKFGQTSRKFRQVQIKSFRKVFVARSIEIRITLGVT